MSVPDTEASAAATASKGPLPQAPRGPPSSKSGSSPCRGSCEKDGGPYLSNPLSSSLSSAVKLKVPSLLLPLGFPAAIFCSSSLKAGAAAASETPQDCM